MFLDDITGPMSVKEAQDKVTKSQKPGHKPGWALDPKTKKELQRRQAVQQRRGVDEDSWSDGQDQWATGPGGGAWSSGESDQWTKESADPVIALTGVDEEQVTELKLRPGQTQDEKYKGWNLRYQMRPAEGSKEYRGRADNLQSQKTQPIGPISAASKEELVQQLKDAIDTSRGSNAITTGRVTIFFNANLAKEIIGHGGDIYADIEKHGDTPLLLLSTEDQGGMIRAQDRSSVAVKGREGHIGAQAFAFPAEKAKAAGLTLARYALGQPINYAPGITAIPLEFRNEVYPGETVRMDEPGLTVSPPKMGQTMGEDGNGFMGADSTSPVGGNIAEDRLAVGDPVIVTAPNAYEGKTGEIAEFSPSGRFVIVRLYNGGECSMHLSDVEYNQYADDEDADEYGEYEDEQGVAEGDDDNTNRLEMMRSEYAKAHKILNKFGNANMGRIEVMRLLLDNGISQKTANIFASKRSIKEQGVAEAGPNAPYTPSPAKPFRNPKGFNKQGTGVGNKLADLNRKEWEEKKKKEQGVTESTGDLRTELARVYRAMAPGIERHRDSHKAGELYDALEAVADARGAGKELDRMMRGARNSAHMEYDTNPGGFENWFWFLPFATDEQGVAEVKQRLDAKCWAGKHKEGTKIKGGVRVNNCVPNEGVAESYWTKLQNERNTRLNSLVNELSESVKKIK